MQFCPSNRFNPTGDRISKFIYGTRGEQLTIAPHTMFFSRTYGKILVLKSFCWNVHVNSAVFGISYFSLLETIILQYGHIYVE